MGKLGKGRPLRDASIARNYRSSERAGISLREFFLVRSRHPRQRACLSTILKTTVIFSRVAGIFSRGEGGFYPVMGADTYIWARPGSNDYFGPFRWGVFSQYREFFPKRYMQRSESYLPCRRIIFYLKGNSSFNRPRIERCSLYSVCEVLIQLIC